MKNKKNIKYIILSVIFILAIVIGLTYSFATDEVASIDIPESYKEVGEHGTVTAIDITRKITGTGPWDSNEQPGNDSSPDNNVVRSFDQISWELEVTTGLKDNFGESSYQGGAIYIEGELPSTLANLVKWDLDSMNWLIDADISDDGTSFSGYYLLNPNDNTVPGKQTLTPILQLFGVTNQTEIKPTFKVTLYGDTTEKSVSDTATIVSAAPKYNIELKRNGSVSKKTTVNIDNRDVTGRMYAYSLVLQLYNDNQSKLLKGIEYPTGNITFDLDMMLERSASGSTATENITSQATPILWNYKINERTDDGIIPNRTMNVNGDFTRYYRYVPLGVPANDRTASVYNSGNISMQQSGSKINVTINNYDFDGVFPNQPASIIISKLPGNPIYAENIGTFHVSYFQVLVPETSASTVQDRMYYLTVSDSNFRAQSKSGVITNSQMNTEDDSYRCDHVLYVPGRYEHSVDLWSGGAVVRLLGSSYETGDAKATIGQRIRASWKFYMYVTNDDDIKSATKFVKFDGNAVTPVLLLDGSKYRKSVFDGDMEFNVWYVTKRDGSNWISQAEMNQADIKDMLYFENIEDIPAGYICVGEYFESKSGVLTTSTGDNNRVEIELIVKDTAKIGEVYGFTQTTKFWVNNLDRNQYSITKNNFNSWPAPTAIVGPRDYIKTEYDSIGQLVSGTHNLGYQWGQSLLIVGSNLNISKSAIDSLENNNYNIGNGETVVTYKLEPILSENESKVKIEGINLKIEDTIPKGITYIPGSSNYGEPEIVNNSDGSTTLTWLINDCITGMEIPPITYKADIYEFSENGIEYESNVLISEVLQNGQVSKIGISPIETRKYKNVIQVINLENYSLSKTTKTPIIEVNGDGNFDVTFTNYTDTELTDFQVLDILPYNNDNRGSKFSGTYDVSSIKLKLTNKDGVEQSLNNLNLYVTNDNTVRSNVNVNDANLGTTSIWEEVSSGVTLNKPLTGYAIVGTIPSKSKLKIEITFKTNGNKESDVYINQAMVQTNKDTAPIISAIPKIEVVKRMLDGYVWEDRNKNGYIDNNEEYLSGVKVTLLDELGNEVIDVNGNKVNSIKSDENGYYKFNNLKKGKYKVKIDFDDEIYDVTKYKVGVDNKINNKFVNTETLVLDSLNKSDEVFLSESYVNAGLVPKDTKVKVFYIDRTHNETLSSIESIGQIGDEYTSKAKDFRGYILVERPKEETVILPKEETILYYYYEQISAGVIEKHIDIYTNEIIDNDKHDGMVGDSYDIKSKEFDNYVLVEDQLPKNAKGKMEQDVIEVRYYYKKKSDVIVKYIDIETKDEIITGDEIHGYIGDDYTTYEKDVDGYELVELPINAEGKMEHELINVVYSYRKIKSQSPQTGDKSNIILWVSLSIIGLLGIIFIIKKIK